MKAISEEKNRCKKEGNTNMSFTEASISEESSTVVPHAGICAGAVR